MKIFKSITDLVGKTPLLEVSNFAKQNGIEARALVKLEMFNPAGSAKDRVALSMIEQAEKNGTLTKGSTIIEPTSGNTGIGLCAIARARGYKCIIVMPETMSEERKLLMKAYGAELVLTDGSLGMRGATERALEIAKSTPNSFVAGQFENPANPRAHYDTTGPEIWQDTEGCVDIFISCVGTGGTISGTGAYLKEQNPSIKVIAVEPSASPLLSCGKAGAHKIQGIGANFIPQNLNREIYDEIITVDDSEAYEYAKKLVESEGVLVGISSGAALCAMAKIASRPENKGKIIVALLPDSGERYLSTPNFI
ncbi:MAG: cysteine synthase A [Ruminococcaceae bacterium]|nr:cysteine synthase A [Oscillospiraceae bacterium]